MQEIVRSPEQLRRQALSAARRVGESAAMVTNLCSAGDSKRAEIWSDEQRVWMERENAAFAAVPLGKQAVRDEAAKVEQFSYEDNLVSTRSSSDNSQSAQAA